MISAMHFWWVKFKKIICMFLSRPFLHLQLTSIIFDWQFNAMLSNHLAFMSCTRGPFSWCHRDSLATTWSHLHPYFSVLTLWCIHGSDVSLAVFPHHKSAVNIVREAFLSEGHFKHAIWPIIFLLAKGTAAVFLREEKHFNLVKFYSQRWRTI